jgi:hypothetical protein
MLFLLQNVPLVSATRTFENCERHKGSKLENHFPLLLSGEHQSVQEELDAISPDIGSCCGGNTKTFVTISDFPDEILIVEFIKKFSNRVDEIVVFGGSTYKLLSTVVFTGNDNQGHYYCLSRIDDDICELNDKDTMNRGSFVLKNRESVTLMCYAKIGRAEETEKKRGRKRKEQQKANKGQLF